MHQPDSTPRPRRDSTAPPDLRSGARRAVDRRPYPTAPTPTRPSFARPGGARASARSRRPVSAPTPATVWVAGATPVDPAATWPPSIVATIVSSFSERGARVALLPWPAPIGPGSPGEPLRGSDPGGSSEVDGALTVIDGLSRNGRLLRISASGAVAVAEPRPPHLSGEGQVPGTRVSDVAGRSGRVSEPADLIIAAAPPQRIAEGRADPGAGRVVDQLALVAARSLRVGGIFVVLTHCDWSRGELVDPGGLIVAAGQCADLLYLQHIVALHLPVRAGRFTPATARAADTGAVTSDRVAAPGPGQSGAHRRIHSDVYVFAQPHDHAPPPYLGAPPEPIDAGAQDVGSIR